MKMLSFVLIWGPSVLFGEPKDTLKIDLMGCLKRAFEMNFAVRRAKLDKTQSRQSRTQTYLSLSPSLSARLGGNTNWGRSIDPTSNQFITRNNRSASVGLSSAINLGNGLQKLREVQNARLQVNIQELGVRAAQYNIFLNISAQYLDVLLAESLVRNSRYKLENIRHQLDRAKKLLSAGTVNALEVRRFESQKASAEADLVRDENQYLTALLTLKQSLQIAYDWPVQVVPEPLSALESYVYGSELLEDTYEVAKSNHPVIQRVKLQVRSADLQLRMARNDFLPALSLSGNLRSNYSSAADRPRLGPGQVVREPVVLGYLTEDPSQTVTLLQSRVERPEIYPNYPLLDQIEGNLSYGFGISLSIPIYDQWRTPVSVQRQLIAKRKAEISVREEENKLRREIENAYQNALASWKLYQASQKSQRLSELTFSEVENKYRVGQAFQNEYEIALNNLYQARTSYLQSQYTLLFRQKILDFYQGKVDLDEDGRYEIGL